MLLLRTNFMNDGLGNSSSCCLSGTRVSLFAPLPLLKKTPHRQGVARGPGLSIPIGNLLLNGVNVPRLASRDKSFPSHRTLLNLLKTLAMLSSSCDIS